MTDKVRAVLVGCGNISGSWLGPARNIHDLEIVGLVDVREEAAVKRREDFGLKHAVVGTDLRRMLKKLTPDAVFDCTVPAAHVKVTIEALRQRCHVLGEKPLADSMKNARRMVAAAAKAGRVYAVIQNRRYDPRIRALRDFLASGRIGQVTTVDCDFYLGPHFGGFRDVMEHVLLLDMAIHTFDAARFITGSDPAAVYCHEWNPAGSWYAHGASAMAIFEMTGGVVYNYRGSWCSEGLPTSWESRWRIVGDKGTVLWDGADGFKAQAVAKSGGWMSEVQDLPLTVGPTDKQGGHEGLIRDFVNCLKTGQTPETVCTDNIKSLAMVFGAIESAEKGKTVALGGCD